MYRRLRVERIVATAERLQQRIEERFAGSGLAKVATQLIEVARSANESLARLGRPIWPIRIVTGTLIVAMIAAGVLGVILTSRLSSEMGNRADLLQAFLALVDEVILIGFAVMFLLRWEDRARRSVALKALYDLRSMAHVIDMHQLTKDPEHILHHGPETTSSPERAMSRFELGRYLDYCSEMLSLTSKLAALHIQDLRDPVVLSAVRDVESLVGTLQSKIWQKKQILELSRQAGG